MAISEFDVAREENLADSYLIKNMDFDDQYVGTVIRNVLQRNQIMNLSQLLTYTEGQLLELQGFGTISLAVLKVKLASLGLKLAEEKLW